MGRMLEIRDLLLAAEGGKLMAEEGFKFDVAFTSTLKRAIRTCYHALEQVTRVSPDVVAWPQPTTRPRCHLPLAGAAP